jgi:hypothetical protein
MGGAVRAGATQHRLNAGHQLQRIKGLVQIIISPFFQGHGPLCRFTDLGEENDGGPIASLAQPVQSLSSIHLGHKHVQDDQIWSETVCLA